MWQVDIGNRQVNPIGLGTWNLGNDPQNRRKEIEAIRYAYHQGLQLIDTAEMYGEGRVEKLIGEAIQSLDREKLYLVSKVLPENASRKQLPISLENSLQRLGVDYLDLYLLHWKGTIELAETIEAMENAKSTGKIKAWGVSNFDTLDMQKLLRLADGAKCATDQVKYNIFDRGIEYDLLPYLRSKQMPIMAYSPILKGNLKKLSNEQQTVLRKIAMKYQSSIFQVLLAWTIRDKKTVAIPKTGNVLHLKENIEALKIVLSPEDLSEIDQLIPSPKSKQALALW